MHSPSDERTIDPRAREKLWSLIKDIRFAMFTARHAGSGYLHAWPMTTQNDRLDEDSSLWFFMSHKNEAVVDIAQDPVVNVVYADPGADSYVSVSGHAAIVDDAAKKRQLWSKLAQAWFPQGAGDPDLALVQVRMTHASYWDVKDSKVVQLFKMARAAVSGKPPSQLGEHAEVRMR